jgi:aldose 1-epimerase
MNKALLLLSLPGLLLFGCTVSSASLTLEGKSFGRTKSGEEVTLFTLQNSNGIRVKVMTYGAIIYSVEVPDKVGKLSNVTANRETLADYEAKSPCFGAVVGRYANRIANARFILDGKEVSITRNAGKNHIHGGNKGFDKVLWKAHEYRGSDYVAVKLNYTAKDGEEGFPGKLECEILYQLNDKNEWRMEYSATTDKPTVVNLSNHAYWNLAGAYSGDVLGHELSVNADRYLLADDALIPTGQYADVAGTPVDFRKPRRVGERIGQISEKQFGGGYDHCLVVRRAEAGSLVLAARLRDPVSGRSMEVWTTEPGVQIFSANFGPGAYEGPGGYDYPRHLGLCLETQHYPDSPNKPQFPDTTLRPGQTFKSTTIHRFSVEP